ncbi:uncharacterized protein LOC135077920 [Ostrinia nubilalis]|uniref:uncharacterized protein LOC135077920 n=1 Tax=Ostrinia nubilalis TaxID=29057 RepID=UPI0030823E1F
MGEPNLGLYCVQIDEDLRSIEVTVDPLSFNQADPWAPVISSQQKYTVHFADNSYIPLHLKDMPNTTSPLTFYELMVHDEIFQAIAECTNMKADRVISNNKDSSRCARINQWVPTNHSEIKKFFGLIMFMGLVKLPRITDYWSKNDILFQPFPRLVMSRNRFELLLQMLHFSADDITNSSHCIENLVNALNVNFKKHFSPSDDLFIVKGPLIVHGKLSSELQNDQETSKYGTRVLKLCSDPGYICKVSLFSRTTNETMHDTLSDTVISLCEDILNEGITLYTDEYFTSLDLARKLLDNETYLVGFSKIKKQLLTLRVATTELEGGSFTIGETKDGIKIINLKDNDACILSTKPSDNELVNVTKQTRGGKDFTKPQILINYEKVRDSVKVCSKVTASSLSLRKSVKWYKNVAIDLLLNTAVMNAFTLYKCVTQNSIQMTDFRKYILQHMCDVKEFSFTTMNKGTVHTLSRKDGPVRLNRRTCYNCYKENAKVIGRLLAKNRSPKVVTYCEACPKQPYLCLQCFNKTHKSQ